MLILLESPNILTTLKKKKDVELLNESNDMDRAFNPFKKKTEGQKDFSISNLTPMDQVIFIFHNSLKLVFNYNFFFY